MKLTKTLALVLALTTTTTFAQEMKVAGQLDSVRVLEVETANKRVYKNLGITTYDVVAFVESSNACMVPDAFVKESIFENGSETIKLSGVISGNKACTADFNPVTTAVLVGTISVGPKAGTSSISVNGLSVTGAE